MWGAPSSGKTTFLAALTIALTRQAGQWEVKERSFLRRRADQVDHRPYPRPRIPERYQGIERYHWVIAGQVTRSVRRRWFGRRQVEQPIRIGLDLVDASGRSQPSHARPA